MQFSDEDIYEAVKNYSPQISEYVNSHGGGIELLGVKDGTVYIKLIGTCSGCSMSLMTTKMVVQRKLRELISPTLNVVNVDGTPENKMPEDVYAPKIKENDRVEEKKDGIINSIKNKIGL